MIKTNLSWAIAFVAGSLLALPLSAKPQSGELLKPYDQMSMALANDDLGRAQRAARVLSENAKDTGPKGMAEHASAVAQSDSLETAREHFKAMSSDAAKLAAGSKQYHVMKCSMVGATWVQSGDKVMNPYMGKAMQQCGSMVNGKEGASMKGMGEMEGMDGMQGMGCCSKK